LFENYIFLTLIIIYRLTLITINIITINIKNWKKWLHTQFVVF